MLRPRRARVRLQQGDVLRPRRRERVVLRLPPLLFVVPGQQREVDDEEEAEDVGVRELQTRGDFTSQRVQAGVDGACAGRRRTA